MNHPTFAGDHHLVKIHVFEDGGISGEVRLPVQSKDEAVSWLKDFQENTKTDFSQGRCNKANETIYVSFSHLYID